MKRKHDAGQAVVAAAQKWVLPFRIELDKIPGAWVVTGWVEEQGVALRLRILHDTEEDVNEVFCEAQVGRVGVFEVVGTVTTCVWDLAEEAADGVFDEASVSMWRDEFREMARRWAAAVMIVEFGSSHFNRYAHEPASSRDAFESGEELVCQYVHHLGKAHESGTPVE